jgi:hypothetical protein
MIHQITFISPSDGEFMADIVMTWGYYSVKLVSGEVEYILDQV